MAYTLDYSFTTQVMEHLESYCNIHDFSKESEVKHLVSYNKEKVSVKNLIETIGLLRSVVFLNNRLISFSPPKSYNYYDFMNKYPIPNSANNCIVEEFVEGTMINVFYNNISKTWEIATRNNIGANNYFYNEVHYSFAELFYDACNYIGLNLESALDKRYCYSFVFQHPYNYIVGLVNNPKLYLIEVYEIEHIAENNIAIHIKNKYEIAEQLSINYDIKLPMILNVNTYEEIATAVHLQNCKSENKRKHLLMGYVIKNTLTGERTNYRNPLYEYLHELRGNQSNFLYQYLSLRKKGKVEELLTNFPERYLELKNYRSLIHTFTTNLLDYYTAVNITKTIQLKNVPYCYKQHVYRLHGKYISEKGNDPEFKITKTYVIYYVNNLPEKVLMHSLNNFYS